MLNWNFRNTDESNEETKVISFDKFPIAQQSQGNKIYFYSDINKESILNLNKQIDELSKEMKSLQFSYDLPTIPEIELHICSDGGDVFSAMASVDKIINNSVPINTYCEGMVASAATLLSVVGKKRYISKNSCMLIHQVSSGLWGNYMEFKDEIKNLELVMNLLSNVYLNHTKLTKTELDDILKHDLCLDSSKCLDFGLVDKIV